eukprot:gb/GEZN01010665.1/.p1 GENE.gb/GEZN01010665.1/~~gb/GEZN01010665.1/.p1  ORF type:complete len:319 (-),score=20.78 gb/GEZN01010665.1/:220-1176(-)
MSLLLPPPKTIARFAIGSAVLMGMGMMCRGHKQDETRRELGVVITGGNRGLGFELAKKFLALGDRVIITSTTQASADEATKMLQELYPLATILGVSCDIRDISSCRHLAQLAQQQLGTIDLWVNNAAIIEKNSDQKAIFETSDELQQNIILTNTLGTVYACKAAIEVMRSQEKGGRIFNTEGGGTNQMATENYGVYGFTKAGYVQFLKTINKELKTKKLSKIAVHNIQPGIVFSEMTVHCQPQNRWLFSVLGEYPDTVASWLVPRIRGVSGTGQLIRFLTFPGVMWRFSTAYFRRNRLWDENGQLQNMHRLRLKSSSS